MTSQSGYPSDATFSILEQMRLVNEQMKSLVDKLHVQCESRLGKKDASHADKHAVNVVTQQERYAADRQLHNMPAGENPEVFQDIPAHVDITVVKSVKAALDDTEETANTEPPLDEERYHAQSHRQIPDPVDLTVVNSTKAALSDNEETANVEPPREEELQVRLVEASDGVVPAVKDAPVNRPGPFGARQVEAAASTKTDVVLEKHATAKIQIALVHDAEKTTMREHEYYLEEPLFHDSGGTHGPTPNRKLSLGPARPLFKRRVLPTPRDQGAFRRRPQGPSRRREG